MDERIKDELEALEAILMNDVEIVKNDKVEPTLVRTKVFPSTAENTKQQYVCLTLEVILTPGYPDSTPIISLKNPRGLDDDLLSTISKALESKCSELVGQPVIFELIEIIRERLTESNLPSCQCAVCLYGFQARDLFTKTPCFHYFHSYCLASHIVNTERHYYEEQDKLPAWQKKTTEFRPQCPVCREPITCDLDSLKNAPPPLELENARQFEVTAELRSLQATMAALFLHQKKRGGIIDLEAEKSKLLLVTGSEEDRAETENDVFAQEGAAAGSSLHSNARAVQNNHHNHRHQHHRSQGIHRYSRGSRGKHAKPATYNR